MMKFIKKVLTRSGFRESFDSQRVLIYHLADLNNVINASIKAKHELSEKALELKKYYALAITDSDNKVKYVHIEKDMNVNLTDIPTCFFEPDIFVVDYYFDEIGTFIINTYKKSECYKLFPKLEFEIFSNADVRKITSA